MAEKNKIETGQDVGETAPSVPRFHMEILCGLALSLLRRKPHGGVNVCVRGLNTE